MKTLIAEIVFNSLTHASIQGLRGSAESQHVILQAEDLSMRVRISKPERERIMLGQLIKTPGTFIAGAQVSLIADSQRIGSTVTNAIGEFRFSGVPSSAVMLQAEIPSEAVFIAKFKIIGD